MRVGDVQDFFRRACGDEFLHHLAPQMARVAHLAVELAVAEQSRAAFAELHVAFRIQLAAPPQAPGVLRALAHRLAALQHDGFQAHLRQHQRGKDAAGAEADDDRALARPIGRRGDGRLPGHVGRGLHVRVGVEAREQRAFGGRVGQFDIDDVHRQQIGLAGVKAALEDAEACDGGFRQLQLVRRGGAQGGVWRVGLRERQAEFGQADHGRRGLWRSSRSRRW